MPNAQTRYAQVRRRLQKSDGLMYKLQKLKTETNLDYHGADIHLDDTGIREPIYFQPGQALVEMRAIEAKLEEMAGLLKEARFELGVAIAFLEVKKMQLFQYKDYGYTYRRETPASNKWHVIGKQGETIGQVVAIGEVWKGLCHSHVFTHEDFDPAVCDVIHCHERIVAAEIQP